MLASDGRTFLKAFPTTLGLAAILICLSSNAWSQVGQIENLSGTGAKVQQAGSLKPQPAMPAMKVEYHDQVTTDPASALRLKLVDNTEFSAVQSTELVFDKNGHRLQLKLLKGGLGEFSVIPPNDLEIVTGNSLERISGTNFDTTYTEGVVRPGYEGCSQYTDLIVREGVVAISNLSNPIVVVQVPAGYETTVPCQLPPLNPGPIGITGARAPATTAAGRTSVAAAVSGSAAPPPEVGPTFPFSVVDP